jgi:selenium metabolism protein YedF
LFPITGNKMKVVDTRGKNCPTPIIETKKALKESPAGEIFSVLTDNRTSFMNVSRFLSDNKIKFTVTESSGVWTFEVNNESGKVETTPAEDYCGTDKNGATGGYAVAVTSEFMGNGDDILGKKLIRSFFVALSVMDELPSVIVFYNSGVKLASKGSEVTDLLTEIEGKGVEVILCGTCVDHFGLGSDIAFGKIGDMYQILQKLAEAGNVIRP